jgi:hypothetical protein
MRRTRIGLLLFLLVVAFQTPARAAPRRSGETATETEWYGWQTLLVDGTSILVGVGGGVATESAAPPIVGLAGYALGAPIVHALHARPAAAVSGEDRCREKGELACSDPGAGWGAVAALLLGGMIGAAGAIGIDAALLAHERTGAASGPSGLQIGLGSRRGGVAVTVSGSF